MWANNVLSNWNYSTDEENKALGESLSVRKWDDTEWHRPTREYLGLDGWLKLAEKFKEAKCR